MRNLMLSTAMVLPLMMAPAIAQDTTTPPPAADATTDTMAEPMGADTAPAADMPADTIEDDAATAEAETAAAEAEVVASGMVAQDQAENELRIDWITNTTVEAADGTAIGDINDVIVDADAGTLKAAIIGVGGFLGIGEKQIAVPWDQLTINYDAQQITSGLTKEQADAAPAYVFRDQAQVPAADGTVAPAPADGTMAPADGTMTTAPAADGTMATPPADPATAPVATPDAAATTSTDPASADAPADSMETPPADGTMPADGITPADGTMSEDDDAAEDAAEGETTPPTN